MLKMSSKIDFNDKIFLSLLLIVCVLINIYILLCQENLLCIEKTPLTKLERRMSG